MDPPNNLPPFSLQWAAGFVDGEACVRIHKQHPDTGANPIYSLEVTVSQNCLETLEHLKDGMGIKGSIYVYPCDNKVTSRVYALTYRCTRAKQALVLLVPYLVRKRLEAQVGIEFADRASTVYRAGRTRHTLEEMAVREAYYQRMRDLKKRTNGLVVA